MATDYHNFVCTSDMTESNQRAQHPPNAKIRMRPHQLALLHKCRQFESQGFIEFSDIPSLQPYGAGSMDTSVGILGDMPGSGKSYVVLALVGDTPSGRHRHGVTSMGNARIVIRTPSSTPSVVGNTLLVIPHTISAQWARYIAQYSDELARDTIIIDKSAAVSNLDPVEMFENYRLVVVTSSYYNRLANAMLHHNVSVHRLVFDEADNLRIPACSHVDNDFTWFVTASYGNLLCPKGFVGRDAASNQLVVYATGIPHSGYIKSIFSDLCRTPSGMRVARALVVRNSDDFVRMSTNLPQPEQFIVRCRTPRYISMLNGYVSSAIMERLNAGDIVGAMHCVDSNRRTTTENVVRVCIEKYQTSVDKLTKSIDAYRKMQCANEEEENMFGAEIARMEERVGELCARIDGIRSRITEHDTCPICLEDISNKSVAPCCAVAMCFSCIQTWIHVRSPTTSRTQCPMCKTDISATDIMVVDDASASSSAPSQTSAQPDSSIGGVLLPADGDKISNLEAILAQRPATARFLICSSFERSFDNVSGMLTRMRMPFAYLKGNPSQVNAVIRQFDAGEVRALLINGSNYGSGINLTATTDVVLFHNFENELQKQVIGRAQRFGRTTPLRLWYLLHDNEAVPAPASVSR